MSPSLWADVQEASGVPLGSHRFRISGEEVRRSCHFCDATFAQDDVGWESYGEHEFAQHERVRSFNWRDLDGQRVMIRVIERIVSGPEYFTPNGRRQIDLVAVADDGTVYFLGDTGWDHGDDRIERGYKCRPKSPESSLLRLMPGVRVSLSDGSKNTDESPGAATAGSQAAPAGRWRTSRNSSGPSTTASQHRRRSRCLKVHKP